MRKKLFAILMSAMMMVTFMPAMAFAADADTATGIYGVTWDFANGKATVNYVNWKHEGKTEVVKLNSHVGTVNTLAGTTLKYASFDLTNDSDVERLISTYDYAEGATVAVLKKDVYDVAKDLGKLYSARESVVDAANYAAWYATQNAKTPVVANEALLPLDKTVFEVTYPEYKAFNYVAKDAEKKYDFDKDASGVVTVTLTDLYKNLLESKDIEVLNTKAEGTIYFNINKYRGFGEYPDVYDYWTDWSLTNSTAKVNKVNTFELTYDGKAHSPALNHPAEATTVTYGLQTKKADGTWTVLKAEDYTATAPELKNVGTYKIIVKTVINKTGEAASVDHFVKINQKAITKFAVKGDQVALAKNYDGKGFAIDASMFDIAGLCDGDALVFPAKETGANVGIYNLTPEIAKLAVLNPNYSFNALQYVTGSAVGTILKADNDCGIKLNSKTVKASALKKAAKKYDVKAYATFGTAKVAKVSGSSKLSISGGQLKIKKGTKKGTYKIQVKVTAAGTANYAEATAFETIKITVK